MNGQINKFIIFSQLFMTMNEKIKSPWILDGLKKEFEDVTLDSGKLFFMVWGIIQTKIIYIINIYKLTKQK